MAYQAPLSTGFSRQGYWSELPFPPPGDLPNPGIEPRCPALQADALPSEPPGKPTPRGPSNNYSVSHHCPSKKSASVVMGDTQKMVWGVGTYHGLAGESERRWKAKQVREDISAGALTLTPFLPLGQDGRQMVFFFFFFF